MQDTVQQKFPARKGVSILYCVILFAFLLVSVHPLNAEQARTIEDAAGRTVHIPHKVKRVICSGPGALRLLTYLQAQNRIVAVDSIEKRGSPVDMRPYAQANPQFEDYPLFGEFRGQDNPELIAALQPQPQVIFRTYPGMGKDPEDVQQKTGVPVIILSYGNLTYDRQKLNRSLRLMGRVLGKQDRAEEVIGYLDRVISDLRERGSQVPRSERPRAYVAGVASRGPHGVRSTNPSYPPFQFLGVENMAKELSTQERPLSQATVAQEKILLWDPEVIFLDIASLHLEGGGNALSQLQNDPAYQSLSAVRRNEVYGVFPYNSYTNNFESILANAYYIGSVLYPERFSDIDPMHKAEEICRFLNGSPAMKDINSQRMDNPAFSRLEVR
ncbi:MAG: iron ABC transporter substrate-binding protein [Desulfohalobiaceae bacterium]